MTFWDELRIRAPRPWSRAAPAHAFLEQDAPYLAAANLYAHLLGGLGQGVQGPVGRLGLVEGFRWQAIVAEKPSGWVLGNQGDDPGTLLLGDAGFPSGTGAVAETVYPFGALKRWRRLLTVFG